MFKLNKKTSTHAVRALMRVPSLRLRWARLKFNYFAKVKSMSRSRLVRRVLELQPDDRGHPQHWLPKTRGELRKAAKDDEKFKQEYDKLLQSLRRNSGVLPLAIDLTVLNEDRQATCIPMAEWKLATKALSERRNLADTVGSGRSTLRTLLRSVTEDAEALPRFPLTRLPNLGGDQIRLRLLAGMSALNVCMYRWQRGRSNRCPHEGCEDVETTEHFLLHCSRYEEERATYKQDLLSGCRCANRLGDVDDAKMPCSEFFEALDDEGKCMFMLGGPVNGRSPEPAVDAAGSHYVAIAYDIRSARLNDTADNPLIVDLTAERGNGRVASNSILNYFSPARPIGPDEAPRSHTHAYARARPPRSIDAAGRPRSGLNGREAKGGV